MSVSLVKSVPVSLVKRGNGRPTFWHPIVVDRLYRNDLEWLACIIAPSFR